jgi:hypothetical protein
MRRKRIIGPAFPSPTVLTPPYCPAAMNFLARASTLTAPYVDPIANFICGCVPKGLINANGTSSVFDVLHLYANQDTTNALLNLVSSSYTGTVVNPSFVAGRGFTGQDLATPTTYINTNFNPVTAFGVYTTTTAHISFWSNTNGYPVNGGLAMGSFNSGAGNIETNIYFGGGSAYYRVNDTVPVSGGVTTANTNGHFIASRTGFNLTTGYRNGVAQANPSVNAGTPQSVPLFVLAANDAAAAPSPKYGVQFQVCMASIGGALTSTQATDFYNLLRTYMTAVGVP